MAVVGPIPPDPGRTPAAVTGPCMEDSPVSDLMPRRAVLKHASLGVVAGVAATTGLGKLPELLSGGEDAAPDLSPLGDDVVVHVRDASSGDVAILTGDREVVHHDPALVGRLLRAARSTGKDL